MKVGFSVADPHDETIAEISRKHSASNLGFLIILDDQIRSRGRAVVSAGEFADDDVTDGAMLIDEIKALLPRYFTVFFNEIRHMAPDLSDVLLVGAPKARKRHLN